ncbi:MAG: aminotransferase class I/II-fold pyridoxal phosphate-dependent enzyme [Polyangiaceae bacterium]|nr:aminotransferase class I/II-fold pyridoxal phosphate-dependent enzyme [Polyangiaceae bacterium]
MSITPTFPPQEEADKGLSSLARGVIGSEILRIASEIRALKAKGAAICNLTVGDFDPAFFPIPTELLNGTRDALAQGHTNYPPSDGVLPLREAVVRLYARELGLNYPVDSVLVAGGARPLLYASYRTLIDPGDIAVYPVPSWNNNHYAYLSGAKSVEIPVTASTNFFPTADDLRPHLTHARMLCINSPLNPTGTAIDRNELKRISELVVEVNESRKTKGERPLYFVFDQVYWNLTFHGVVHETPVALVPETAPYTLLLDAISKSLCATGMRVGWGVMPPAVRKRMADILGHVGAWAPKAEQMAVATLLDAPEKIAAFQTNMKAHVKERLDALYNGLSAMKRDGLPVEAISPQGAIYLSAQFNLIGKTAFGQKLQTNDDIRRLLLNHAGLAVVPFQAFGLKVDTGWFRMSVGAVSMPDIEQGLVRLRETILAAN